MGALEELDDPGALQPEGEVTEHPTEKSGRIVDRAGSPRSIVGPSEIPVHTDCPA